MHYIVFDLEFNQDISSIHSSLETISQCPYEIIQIGALKLDIDYQIVATFNRYVRPSIYSRISPFVTELTKITTDQLLNEKTFPETFNDFIDFIVDKDSIFLIWGAMDMKVLFKNVSYHNLDENRLPLMFINIQPYVSTYFNLSTTQLLNLQAAVESLGITLDRNFHNALHDAYYTAEIFKKINNPSIKPMKYDPNYNKSRPRQPKKVIDFEGLLLQFEKMYARKLSQEEQEMIQLAYKMGKTNQFLK